MKTSAIKRVCILGGTHGNELSGVYLLKKFQDSSELFRRSSFETATCKANPRAVEVNRRYIDVDLNRSFSPENMAAEITKNTPYEVKRVQELKAILSDGGEIGPCDVILDLHNTTASTKLCLIHGVADPLTMQMMHYVSSKFPSGTCYTLYLKQSFNYNCTRGLAPRGIGVEVGPQPQGVIRSDIFHLQEDAVNHCLDFIEQFNSGVAFPPAKSHTYEVVGEVPFPRDSKGVISAMIHSKLQDKDWAQINADDAVFEYLDGRILKLRDVVDISTYGGETLYPIFINEAAYYEKDTAFCLTKKVEVSFPELMKS